MVINEKHLITKTYEPKTALPLIFDSPHSGRNYPEDFNFSCDFDALQRAEDNYVDALFSDAPHYGGSLLCALFPRTYIDVNRAYDDIDPDLINEDELKKSDIAIKPSERAHAGIGLIRRVVKPGMAVYDRKLSLKEIEQRIEKYYKPYHEELDRLICKAHYNFGKSWHINCHSMPQRTGFSRPLSHSARSHLPDFVLGDRDGTSSELAFTHALRDFLKERGYKVTINNPYRGVEIIKRHASPQTGRSSVQIEINKALYWDEQKNEHSKNYDALKEDINRLIEFSASFVSQNLTDIAAD